MRTLLFDVVIVREQSMAPGLIDGDIVLVRRFVRAPTLQQLERGDILVIRQPADSNGTRARALKRLAGMAGDTLSMVDGLLFVNRAVPTFENGLAKVTGPILLDFQPPSMRWIAERSGETEGARPLSFHNWPDIIVPNESVFVLGDNRPKSSDSRIFGFISRKDVFGRLLFHVRTKGRD